MPALMYGSETMLWKKEISRVRAVRLDNLRGLLGIRMMDIIPNAWIRELCGVRKGLGQGFPTGGSRSLGRGVA